MSASRSTTWTIHNRTADDFQLVSAELDHGVWASSAPQTIKSGRSGTFRAESDGFMTGDEGSVTYASPAGNWKFYFDNPYIGACGFNAPSPEGYNDQTTQTTGSDQVLNSDCTKA